MQPPIDPIVAELVELLDENLREPFEERAAIIEYEAGKARPHAECLALLLILKQHPEVLTHPSQALVLAPQSMRVQRSKLVAPEANRFVSNDNSSLSQEILNIPMAQIEPIVEPDGVLNDRRSESVPLVQACLSSHPATVAQSRSIWPYRRGGSHQVCGEIPGRGASGLCSVKVRVESRLLAASGDIAGALSML
jgi:hypothetical protein